MESRRLLSTVATLALQNRDGVPGDERMIFNRIGHPNTTIPNVVHDKATLRLKNIGGSTLYISSISISGSWKITNTKPTSILAGSYADLTIQFTASAPPTYSYNETNGTTETHMAGAYTGSLTVNSSDLSHPKQVEQLAGWYQDKSENSEEPSLQSIINLVGNYKTNINSTKTPTLSESSGKKLYGEEVNSAYWSATNPSGGVYVRTLATFHTQGNTTTLYWYKKGSTSTTKNFTTNGNEGQSLLPHLYGSTTSAAAGTFYPSTSTFGFKIDGEWSDDKKNNTSGGGHHVRFYPVRDHNGNLVANTYFMVMDYAVSGYQNYDFQDAVYVISGIKPMGN